MTEHLMWLARLVLALTPLVQEPLCQTVTKCMTVSYIGGYQSVVRLSL